MFQKINSKADFPAQESEILTFWEDNNTFEQSLEQRRGNEEFVFYDGPPFATGLPHYGHLLAGTIKDVVPRYQTMCGRYVDRVFGWDCHGLPVENEMEKELEISSKHEIEAYGVGRFNEACRKIVLRYTAEWQSIVRRMGRWVDFENGYRTMDRNYMESIWWVFRKLWDQKLIYEGHKILPYCPRCATPLSNFEANQGYREVDDPSITIRFQVKGQDNTSLLAWTTTPWTLPSNLALAVGPDIDYVKVRDGDQIYIMAKDRLAAYYRDDQPEIVETLRGKALLGLAYEPLFPYFAQLAAENAFRVITADFVSTSDGTGIVHIAPGFGEDDAATARAHDIPAVCPIDAECRYTEEIDDYAGEFVKDCDKRITAGIKKRGRLIHQGTLRHNYPHCWRCDAPLIYRAISTWFVDIATIKQKMLNANADIHWVPEHIKDGRFGKWLENAHDWAISRNRYWGCPLPIWRNADTGDTVCIGSIAELEAMSGREITDIHKHFVDDIELKAASGAVLTRVPEVLDCWFESGAMPYAQRHYPFENEAWLNSHFPADFIAEGLDQTRGWFYTLVVLGAALFDKPAFRNVIVNGLVLAEDGRKMSKRLKNYPAPEFIMDKYGADALRLCLLSSPVMRGEDLRFSEATVKDAIRSLMLPLWNAYSFLITYATVDEWKPTIPYAEVGDKLHHSLDRWILGRLESLVTDVRTHMDAYDIQSAATRFTSFIDNLTNWYIRRSRRRFWKSQNDGDKDEAYHTLYYALITYCRTAAPFTPFITETIYRNLRTESMPESVHLTDFPAAAATFRDDPLEHSMALTIRSVSLGRFLRSQAGLRTRQPLRRVILVSPNATARKCLATMQDIIAEELNVKSVSIDADESRLVTYSAKANFRKLGPQLGGRMKHAATAIARLEQADIVALMNGDKRTISLGDNDNVTITVADIELVRAEKDGMAAANDGDVTVALDMTIDDALEREGQARELVNRLQNLRKDKGFNVDDRIVVDYAVPAPLQPAIETYADYIAGEVLAAEFRPGLTPSEVHRVDIDGHSCYFELAKVDA